MSLNLDSFWNFLWLLCRWQIQSPFNNMSQYSRKIFFRITFLHPWRQSLSVNTKYDTVLKWIFSYHSKFLQILKSSHYKKLFDSSSTKYLFKRFLKNCNTYLHNSLLESTRMIATNFNANELPKKYYSTLFLTTILLFSLIIALLGL